MDDSAMVRVTRNVEMVTGTLVLARANDYKQPALPHDISMWVKPNIGTGSDAKLHAKVQNDVELTKALGFSRLCKIKLAEFTSSWCTLVDETTREVFAIEQRECVVFASMEHQQLQIASRRKAEAFVVKKGYLWKKVLLASPSRSCPTLMHRTCGSLW